MACRHALAWLYEVPLAGVVSSVLAQLRWGAPYALVALTLLPARLIGVAQQLAPDWVTAAMQSWRLFPGNPLRPAEAVAGATNGAEAKKGALITAAGRKEE